MRRAALAIFALSALAALWILPARQPQAADAPAAPIQKWEYSVLNHRTFQPPAGGKALGDLLNERGQAGWELCGMSGGDDGNQIRCVLKRPLK